MTTTSLSAYHSANYYSKCPQESPILSSWPYVVYPLQYSNVFFIPLALLAGYCILAKTPKPMQPMKWVYFNLHFWTSFQSVSISILITPICWLPTISTSMLGVLSKIGVPEVHQAYLAMSVMMLSLSAIISLFENRHQMIQQNRFRIQKPLIRYTILGFNYIMSCLYIVPLFIDIPDQLSAKLAVLDSIPCPYEDFFQIPVFTLSTDPKYRSYIAYSSIIAMAFTMIQLNFYSSTCLHYLVFNNSNHSSKVTNARQKKFFLGILVQISIPYGFMSPAMAYSCWSLVTGNYYHKLNNLSILIFNFYGIVSTSTAKPLSLSIICQKSTGIAKWRSLKWTAYPIECSSVTNKKIPLIIKIH